MFQKRVVITGASSGVGQACAYWFLNNGANVVLVGRDIESMKTIGSKFPGQATVIQCNLALDHQQYYVSTTVIEKFGGLDILINCAGMIFDGDVESTYPQDYDYIMDLNLRCPFHLTSLFAQFLERSKGCVVNVSCAMGSRPQPGCISYAMSKAGLEMMTKVCALEFAPLGVRVNAVAPGITDTNMFVQAGLSESEWKSFKARAAGNIPMQRIASAEDVAKAIVFLCSQEASNITGHIMKVDGGKTLTQSGGFTPYYGMEYMDRRFEASSFSKATFMFKSVKDKVNKGYSSFPQGSADWVSEKQTSNWATHNEEAHSSVTQPYEKMEQDDDKLKYFVEMHEDGGLEKPKAARKF